MVHPEPRRGRVVSLRARTTAMRNGVAGLQILGWREWLALPELGIQRIKAKVDSGARSSCLHALDIEEYRQHGRDHVRFRFERAPGDWDTFHAPVVDRRAVRDSGGHRTVRPFIRTEAVLGEARWPIELNLATRTDMLFPMLLGRTAMLGRFVIDPSRSYVLGAPAPTSFPLAGVRS